LPYKNSTNSSLYLLPELYNASYWKKLGYIYIAYTPWWLSNMALSMLRSSLLLIAWAMAVKLLLGQALSVWPSH